MKPFNRRVSLKKSLGDRMTNLGKLLGGEEMNDKAKNTEKQTKISEGEEQSTENRT